MVLSYLRVKRTRKCSNPATPIHCKVLDFQGLFLLHFMLYHGTFLIFSMFPFGVSL